MNDNARPLVECKDLRKSFVRSAGVWTTRTIEVHAVSGVDLEVCTGEIVGLVGESGSGKSTLGRMLIRLIEPDAGSIRFDGIDLLALKGAELRKLRRSFQIIFQDPYGSLNPRMRVGSAIGEPLTIHKLVRGRAERRERVAELLDRVGLDASAMERYPHEFSGGQRQRIGIARAIACSPRFIVADEPVSALDSPVQGDVPGPDRRVGARRPALPQSAPPLHPGVAGLHAVAGARLTHAARAQGRATLADPAAHRLCVPPALPAGRAALLARRACSAGSRTRP